jgi:hypothetical protein
MPALEKRDSFLRVVLAQIHAKTAQDAISGC